MVSVFLSLPLIERCCHSARAIVLNRLVCEIIKEKHYRSYQQIYDDTSGKQRYLNNISSTI